MLGPVLALLPQVSDLARGSLMLRMLRVGRAVAFGTRAGTVAVRTPRDIDYTMRGATPTVTVVTEGDLRPIGPIGQAFLPGLASPPRPGFTCRISIAITSTNLRAPQECSELEIDLALDEDGHAKLREGAHHATLILNMPTVTEVGFPDVHRDRLLAVVTKEGILTATTGSFDLHASVEHLSQRTTLPDVSICRPNRLRPPVGGSRAQPVHRSAIRRRGASPRGPGGRHVFLRETFRLRREISTAALDLWHLKGIVRALADGKTTLRGIDLKEEKYLDDLLAETDSLYETVNKSKEEIKTLIELHINFKSFEMNAILKLLAIVSFLGLIPTVAGGLLGMNLAGNPWPVTLGQVTFGITMGMATALYVFAVKGWLK